MRYPNTRYGNPEELRYYTEGMSIKEVAKRLKRSEKSVKQWLSFEKKVPYWVPELLRLWDLERGLILRQMGMGETRRKLGLVEGQVIQFRDLSRTRESLARVTASNQEQENLDCSYAIKRSAAL